MSSVASCDLPEAALLQRYRQSGAYTDCYRLELPCAVSPAEYVEAFYTTRVFKLERWLLARFVGKQSSDAEAHALACGLRETFAAWTVEARADGQLLLCDFQGRTRSWLMCTAMAGESARTHLYFGSAVVPVRDPRNGALRMGFAYRALLGFHKLYSRILLWAAAQRLRRARR